jgi:hypothetical protein
MSSCFSFMHWHDLERIWIRSLAEGKRSEGASHVSGSVGCPMRQSLLFSLEKIAKTTGSGLRPLDSAQAAPRGSGLLSEDHVPHCC